MLTITTEKQIIYINIKRIKNYIKGVLMVASVFLLACTPYIIKIAL